MTEDPRIPRLLDELLDSNSDPERVCAACPDLLPVVRRRWQQIRRLGADLDALFPAAVESSPPGGSELPIVPGYEVEGVLGRGGMGIVFRARHLRLNRPVALKMILAGPYAVPEERERFVHEAEAVAAISHPNIVQVHNAGESDGRPWFTMELVEGGRLSQRIAGVPQSAREAASLVAAVAGAVHAAHQKGVVHRDLKPSNILLAADGTPKVTDFGLARRLEGDGGLTMTGVPVGTPSYMAPEQARGDKGALGPAIDVYALGTVLYELLTGRPPFRADTATATIQHLLAEDPVPPARLNPRVPRDLQTICLKCLAKEPAGRYATAAALADDLGRFMRGESIRARAVGPAGRLARWVRRRPTAAGLAAALAATALLALALVGFRLRQDGQRQATARAAEQDLREVDRLIQQSDVAGGRAALERARGRLAADGSPALVRRAGAIDAALTLHGQLDAMRLHRADMFNAQYDPARAQPDRDYEKAFLAAGLDTAPGQTAEAFAARVSGSPAHRVLVVALDDWAGCTGDKRRREWLLKVARLADPDPWRDRARDPGAWEDRAKLTELTDAAPIRGQSLPLLLALGQQLSRAGGDPRPFLRRVEQEHPDDFWANLLLALALMDGGEPATAIGFFRMALALRPDAPAAINNLGCALLTAGRPGEAVFYLERAVQVDPLSVTAHVNLGAAYDQTKRPVEALAHFREAVRLGPTNFAARAFLAAFLNKTGREDEALAMYEESVRLHPGNAGSHYDVAPLLVKRGRRDEAAARYRAALAINPRFAAAHHHLGRLLWGMGQGNEATDHFRQAAALEPKDEGIQADWRAGLLQQGHLEEARAAWRTALDAGVWGHRTFFGYAELCLFLGREDEYRRARRDLLARFGGTTDPTVAERTGRACLLLPGTNEELLNAVALTHRALAAGREGHEFAYPYYVFARGLADYRLGRYDEAIAAMRGEAAGAGGYMGPSPRLVLAMALHRKQQKDEALKTLAAAVGSYDWAAPAADHNGWIAHVLRREAEGMVLPELPAFLDGKLKPRDNDERLALLGACQSRGLRAAEAGLYAAAFAADPPLADDVTAGHRYRAARAAAVAGTGGGADGAGLGEPARARRRRQAVDWLGQDLAARAKRLDGATTADRAEVLKVLARWRATPDLAGVRDANALKKLPPAEAQQWQQLWQQVADVLRGAETGR